MREFKYFLTHMSKDFKKIVVSGVDLDKMRPNMMTFVDFVGDKFEKQLEVYSKVLGDLDNIKLENIIDAKYKYLFRTNDIRATVQFVEEMVGKFNEFTGNESTLRVMIGVYGLYFAFIVKIVDTYLGTIAAGRVQDRTYNFANVGLKDIGIDGNVLRYYRLFEDLREKTLSDWEKVKFNANEEKYIISAVKRVFLIFGF